MPLVRNSQNPNGVNVTDEAFANSSNFIALKYLETEPDVQQQAVAKTLARGITPDNPEYATVLANYGKEHYARYGRFEPARQSIFVDAFKENQGYYDVGQASVVGAAPQLVYQGSTAESFINTVPRIDGNADNQPPGVIPTPNGLGFQFPNTGGDDTGGDSDTGGTDSNAGGGTDSNAGGGGIMSGPVGLETGALNPVTNLIGATGDTGQSTLMGRQADLASDVAGVRGVVDPLAAQVTGVGGQVTGVGEQVTGVGEQVTGVGEQVTGLGTQIGTADTDAGQTDLFAGQAGIMSGQQGLADTQANILEGQTGLAGTQAGLMSRIGDTATDTRPATGLIGAVGTAGTPGTATQAAVAPTGLFAGQQTLGTNISGVGGQVTQVGQDVSGIASALANFENISSQERANLLSTLNTRAQELENLENMYGFQTNRLVEAQLGNTGSTGLQPGMMQPPATDPGSLNSILAAERAAQATGQNISSNLTSAANQGLVSNALGPVGTQ